LSAPLQDEIAGGTGVVLPAEPLEQKIARLRRESSRRIEAMTHVFSQIEKALRTLMATPLIQGDELCQAIIEKMVGAQNTEEFAALMDDLHFRVRHLLAQRNGAEGVIAAGAGIDRRIATAPSDAHRSGEPETGRYRLRL